jgi:hypothetical protein
MFSACHRKTHWSIEAGQISWMQAAGLALLQTQPNHTAYSLLDVVVDRYTIAIKEDRGGQGIEALPLSFRNGHIGVERDSGGYKVIPRIHMRQLGSELLSQLLAMGLTQHAPRPAPVMPESLQRSAHFSLVRVWRVASQKGLNQRTACAVDEVGWKWVR